MTRKFTGIGQRCAVAEQLGNKGVPAAGVEVDNARRRLVGNIDSFEVLLNHEPRFLIREAWKKKFAGSESTEPRW